jgi:hypothetical protein
VKRLDHESSNRQRSSSITINHGKDKTNPSIIISKKKHSRKQQLNQCDSSIDDSLPTKHRKHTNHEEIIHNKQSKNEFVYFKIKNKIQVQIPLYLLHPCLLRQVRQ